MKIIVIALIILPLALVYIGGIWVIIRKYGKGSGKSIHHQKELYRKKLCEALKSNEK